MHQHGRRMRPWQAGGWIAIGKQIEIPRLPNASVPVARDIAMQGSGVLNGVRHHDHHGDPVLFRVGLDRVTVVAIQLAERLVDLRSQRLADSALPVVQVDVAEARLQVDGLAVLDEEVVDRNTGHLD